MINYKNVQGDKEVNIGHPYHYKTEEVKYLSKCEHNEAIDKFKSKVKGRILAGEIIGEKYEFIDNCDID